MRSIQVIPGVAALLLILVLVQGAMAAETYGYVTQWGSKGSGDTQLYGPSGVAVDRSSGNVYVADTYNNRIQKFTSDGKMVLANWGSYGPDPGQFAYPWGIAVDSSGNVYVADNYNSRIQEFSSDGKTVLANWGSKGSDPGLFNRPLGIAIDPLGNVYVADTQNNRIQKFTTDGTTLLADWGSKGSDDGQFSEPLGVAVDSSGNVYVLDYDNDRIQEFAKVATTGSIVVTSTPTGAEIYLDGTNTGQKTVPAGTALTGVPLRSHDVVVKLKCYTTPAMQSVTVSPTTVATADFSLTSDGTCTDTPEFPSIALPVAMIIGFLGTVLFIRRTREH